MSMDTSKWIVPIRELLSHFEEEEIQAIDKEASEKKSEEEDYTLVTLDVGELLVIWRSISKRFLLYLSKGSKSSTLVIPLEARCVSLLLIKVIAPMASMTFIDKLQVPTKVHPTPYTLQWLK